MQTSAQTNSDMQPENGAARRTPGWRSFAAASAGVAVLALAGQAAVLSWMRPDLRPRADQPRAAIQRIDAGPVEKRDLAFYPEHRAADDSLRAFKPGPAWTPDPAVALTPAVAASALVAAQRPRMKLAGLHRPATKKHAAPVAASPAPVRLVAQRAPEPTMRATINGFDAARFVPTGADIVRRLSDFGSSIGKLVRISSR